MSDQLALFSLTPVLSVRSTADKHSSTQNAQNNSQNSNKVRLEHVAAGRCGEHMFVAAAASNGCLVLRHCRQFASDQVSLIYSTNPVKPGVSEEDTHRKRQQALAEAAMRESKPVLRVIPWLLERPQKRIIAMKFNAQAAAQWLLIVTLDCTVYLMPVYFMLVRAGGSRIAVGGMNNSASQGLRNLNNSNAEKFGQSGGWFSSWRTADSNTTMSNNGYGSNNSNNNSNNHDNSNSNNSLENNEVADDLVDGAGRSLTDLTQILPNFRALGVNKAMRIVATDGLWWQASNGEDYAIVSASNGAILFFDVNRRRMEPLIVRLRAGVVRLSLVGPAHGQTHLLAISDRNQVFKILLEYEDAGGARPSWLTVVDAYAAIQAQTQAEGNEWVEVGSGTNDSSNPLAPFAPVLLSQMDAANIDLSVQTDGAAGGEDWVVLGDQRNFQPNDSVAADDAGVSSGSSANFTGADSYTSPAFERPFVRGPMISRFFQQREEVVGVYYSPCSSPLGTGAGGGVSGGVSGVGSNMVIAAASPEAGRAPALATSDRFSGERNLSGSRSLSGGMAAAPPKFGGLLRVFDSAEIREVPMYEYLLPTHTHLRSPDSARVETLISGVYMTDKFVFGVEPGFVTSNHVKRPPCIYVMSKHLLGRSSVAHYDMATAGQTDVQRKVDATVHSRTSAVLQVLELPINCEVRGLLPALSVVDSLDATRTSPVLHDPADLPSGCLVWTADGEIFEVRPIPNAGQRLFSHLVSHGQDSLAEPLGKTLGLDVFQLYEVAADERFARGEHGRALSLYFLSNVKPQKLVAKFARINRVDVIVTFCRNTMDAQAARLPKSQKMQISNILFCALLYNVASAQAEHRDDDTQLSVARVRLLTFCRTNLDFDLQSSLELVLNTYVDVAHVREGSNRSSARRFCPQHFDMLTLALEIRVRTTFARQQAEARKIAPRTLLSSSGRPTSQPPEHEVLRPIFDEAISEFVERGYCWRLTGDELSWALQWSLAEGASALGTADSDSKLAGMMKWFRGALWRQSLFAHFNSDVVLPLNSDALSAVLISNSSAIREIAAELDALVAHAALSQQTVRDQSVAILRWVARISQQTSTQERPSGLGAAARSAALLELHIRTLLSLARLYYAHNLDLAVRETAVNFGGPQSFNDIEQMLALSLVRLSEFSDAFDGVLNILTRHLALSAELPFKTLCTSLTARLYDMRGEFVAALSCRWLVCIHAPNTHVPLDSGTASPQCLLKSFKQSIALKMVSAQERIDISKALFVCLFDKWEAEFMSTMEAAPEAVTQLEEFLVDLLTEPSDGEPEYTHALVALCQLGEIASMRMVSIFSLSFWSKIVLHYEKILAFERAGSHKEHVARSRRLWTSITENLQKATHARAFLSVSTVSLEPKAFIADGRADTCLHGDEDSRDKTVLFSCGHRFAEREFYSTTLPEFERIVTPKNADILARAGGADSASKPSEPDSSHSVLPLGAVAQHLIQLYQKLTDAPQPVACPTCMLVWIREESKHALDAAAADALRGH